jgi:hypothetical protein
VGARRLQGIRQVGVGPWAQLRTCQIRLWHACYTTANGWM